MDHRRPHRDTDSEGGQSPPSARDPSPDEAGSRTGLSSDGQGLPTDGDPGGYRRLLTGEAPTDAGRQAPATRPGVPPSAASPETDAGSAPGRWLRAVASALLILLATAAWSPLGPPVESAENWTLSWRFSQREPRTPDPRLLLIKIGHPTYRALGSRIFTFNPHYAKLIDIAINASASAVFIDHLDIGYDRPIREMLTAALDKAKLSLDEFFINNQVGFDLVLRRALARSRSARIPVWLGFAASSSRNPLQSSAFGEFLPFVPQPPPFVNLDFSHQMVRQHQVFATDLNGTPIPSVALAIASHLAGPLHYESEGIRLGGVPVAGLHRRRGLIDFAGPADTFAGIELLDLLTASGPTLDALHRQIQGRVLLVGDATEADRRAVPVRHPHQTFALMQGVEIHAHVTDNLLRRCFLQTLEPDLELLLIGLLLTLHALAWGGNVTTGVVGFLLLAGTWTAVAWQAFAASWCLPMARPLLGMLAQAIAYGTFGFIAVDRQRRAVRTMLGHYLNDKVVRRVLAQQGGIMPSERRRIAVLICDIRNFTTFAEARDPSIVTAFLNQALAEMSEVVLTRDGLVDKFLGDGMLALFNTPLDSPGFAAAAADAALTIRERFDRLLRLHPATIDGSHQLRLGVAVHVGEAIVGNLGSERKMEYTAIGDVVNTASRLEALNKKFNTSILASDELRQEAGPGYLWEEIGEEQLRGRRQPIMVCSLTGRKDDRTAGEPSKPRGE